MRLLVVALVLLAALGAETSAVRRAYTPGPARLDALRELAGSEEAESYFARTGAGDDLLAECLRFFLHEQGLDLPRTAAVRWNRSTQRFEIEATDDQHARIGRALISADEWQVEADAALIAFPLADLEKLARQQEGAGISAAALKAAWTTGGGRLIGSAKVRTRHNITARMFSGDEIAYAGSVRALASATSTNEEVKGPRTSTAIAVGTELMRQQVGFEVTLTPAIALDLRSMELNVVVRHARLAGMRSTGLFAGDGTNPPKVIAAEVPDIRARQIQASLLAADGSTHMLGGIPTEDGAGQIYLLLTARLVDREGAPWNAHDFRGVPVSP